MGPMAWTAIHWRRATWQGGVASILGGATCTVVVKFHQPFDEFWGGAAIPAVICAFVAGVAISLLTPANTVSDDEALEILATERQAMEMHDESVDSETTVPYEN